LDKLPEGKVVILAINVGDNATDVQDFAERWEIGFPVLLDLDKKVAYDYEVSKTPITFIIDSQGIIRVIKDGAFADQEEIESAINSMLETSLSK
jgi:peroxiredoxin